MPRESDAPRQATKSRLRHRQAILKGRPSRPLNPVPHQHSNAASKVKVFTKLIMRPPPASEMPSAV
jgi:hypothetical protein